MRFSVVINTYNRAASLTSTLDALRQQTFEDFEVVVVNGPSTDDTDAVLKARAGELRVVDCDERVLGVSRNLGIDATAGDVVAFVDDDAVPEPRWLEDLARAYTDGVGGAGGLTLDQTGTRAQYRWSVCNRLGEPDFDREPPLDAFNRPGADPFLYLQGTNASFRRSVLEEVQGFDEHFDYIYDESELASRVIDAGYELRALEDAVVHHKFLPSHLRAKVGPAVSVTDPFVPIKNRAYFALRVGGSRYSLATIFTSLTDYMDGVRAWAIDTGRRGFFSRHQLDFWMRRADEGLERGVEDGLHGEPRTRPIAPADPDAFLPYPRTVVADGGRRLCVAFSTLDYPPRPLGGIARFTQDLARGCAAAGHEAHVVTRDDLHGYRMDFEDGVWVHRFPVRGRRTPGVDGHPLEGNLDHLASVRNAVEKVAERAPVDVVAGSLWIGEPLLCALDPRWVTAVACNTPIRKVAELQPHTAAAEVTPWQEKVEAALLGSGAFLQPVSHENARLCEEIAPRQPMEVIWHGVEDRRAGHPRTRTDDAVEILFVGRLEPRKGIDTLLEAAPAVLASRPNVRIRVVGGDNPHANGRPDAFADAASDQILFAGELPDDALYDAFAGADVFCGPSRYESFGLVHVEAMMMGLPVVACAVGGMRETVVEGETGRLVAPGDAAALAEALAALCDDAGERRRMGTAGRARYEAEFRVERAVERNVAAWRGLVEAHAVPDDPGRVTQERTEALLARLCDLDVATATAGAAALLDTRRFPIDYEDGVRRLLSAPDRDFVGGVYHLLLEREPEPRGLLDYLHRLEHTGLARIKVVDDIARSQEARGRGVDPRFVLRVPTHDPRALFPDLRTAWLHDDATFASAVVDVVVGPRATDADREDAVALLAEGGTRRDLLAEVAARLDVADRVIAPERLLEIDAYTREELHARVAVLATAGDAEFVDGVYELVLGRPADPGGAYGYQEQLARGVSRREVLVSVAGSAEAEERGIPPELVTELGNDLPAPEPRAPEHGARRAVRRILDRTRSVP